VPARLIAGSTAKTANCLRLYVATREKNRIQAIYFSRLGPGQTAWAPMRRLLDSERALGNPVLYQHVDGCLWLIYVEMVLPRDWDKCRLHAIYSHDDGATWSERRTLVEFLGYMPRNHPLLLRDGSIVLPLYDEHKGRSVFLISRDDGETWELGGDIISTPGKNRPRWPNWKTDRSSLLCACAACPPHLAVALA